jgi:hypothetical protein
MLNKYIEKIRMASRAWDENPEMKVVWLRTAERIISDMHDEVLSDIVLIVSNMPTYAVVNEQEIQEMGDDEYYTPNVKPAVSKEDLINSINKIRNGTSSGME